MSGGGYTPPYRASASAAASASSTYAAQEAERRAYEAATREAEAREAAAREVTRQAAAREAAAKQREADLAKRERALREAEARQAELERAAIAESEQMAAKAAQREAAEEADFMSAIKRSLKSLFLGSREAATLAAMPEEVALPALSDAEIIDILVETLDIESRDVEIKPDYICPITSSIFRDPVTNAAGFHYERSAIEEWLKPASDSGKEPHDTDPTSNEVLAHKEVTPDLKIQREIKQSLQRELIEKIDSLDMSDAKYKQLVPDPSNVPLTKPLFVEASDPTLSQQQQSVPR